MLVPFELNELNTTVFSFFREKVTDSVVWNSIEHSRSETKLYKPASHGKEEQFTQGLATHWGFSSLRRSETASG